LYRYVVAGLGVDEEGRPMLLGVSSDPAVEDPPSIGSFYEHQEELLSEEAADDEQLWM
jgi:hypothetical protein